MFGKKYILAIFALTGNLLFSGNSVSVMPMQLITKKAALVAPKKRAPKKTTTVLMDFRTKLKKNPLLWEYLMPLNRAMNAFFEEMGSAYYFNNLSSKGEKIKDIFPVSVSFGVSDSSTAKYIKNTREINEKYETHPEFYYIKRDGISLRKQFELADFKSDNVLQISFKGPLFYSPFIASAIRSIASDKRNKAKEFVEGVIKMTDSVCDMQFYSESVKLRRKQVAELQKNLSNLKIRASTGSASDIDVSEAVDSLGEHENRLTQDVLYYNSLFEKCRAFKIDSDEAIKCIESINENMFTTLIKTDSVIEKMEDSLRVRLAKDEYSSMKGSGFQSMVSTFSPNLELTASVGSESRDFTVGIKTEGVKFGQFMKHIGQNNASIYNYNQSLRSFYADILDLVSKYNSLVDKYSSLVRSLQIITKNLKSMESMLKDAASKDSSTRGKVSDWDVLKLRLSKEEANIKISQCKSDIIKIGFKLSIMLEDGDRLVNMMKRPSVKNKILSIDDIRNTSTPLSVKPAVESKTMQVAKNKSKKAIIPSILVPVEGNNGKKLPVDAQRRKRKFSFLSEKKLTKSSKRNKA